MGRLSNQDFVGSRGLLETLGDTHSLASDESMSLSVDASKDLPSVEANPMSQLNAPNRLKLMVQCRKRIAHLDSGGYSP